MENLPESIWAITPTPRALLLDQPLDSLTLWVSILPYLPIANFQGEGIGSSPLIVEAQLSKGVEKGGGESTSTLLRIT